MRITRAAIKFKHLNSSFHTPEEYRIKIGWRHSDIFCEMYKENIVYDRNDYEMGFITDERPMHFVNRQEAAKIAYKSGQISEPKKILYSEDLW